jgi:hypothetical protein
VYLWEGVVGVHDAEPLVIGYLSRYNHYVAVISDNQESGSTDYDFDDGDSNHAGVEVQGDESEGESEECGGEAEEADEGQVESEEGRVKGN